MSSQKRSDSYKRLPCKGLIRDGYCPYKSRCQYIHDEEFKIDIILPKKKQNNIEESDLFYYPPQKEESKKYEILGDKIKMNRLPILEELSEGKSIQDYIVPSKLEIDGSSKKENKYKLLERDSRTSCMYNNLKTFIIEQRKNEKVFNSRINKFDKLREKTKSPEGVADLYK
jgi:hypothetical protein